MPCGRLSHASDLIVHDGAAFASSLDVARVFGKQHKDVVRKLQNIVRDEPEAGRSFALSEYTDPTGHTLPCYEITRDGFTLLGMASPAFRPSGGSSLTSPMNALVHNQTEIRERDEMLSLMDMWKAGGKIDAKRPTDWLALSSTIDFREAVEATFNAGNSGILSTKGRNGGTWAHWQIAFAYAKCRSPERDRVAG